MWQDNWWEKCKYIFGCHSITQRHFYVLQINGIAKNVFFFIFPLYLHYHRFDWKNFSITNAKNLFMRWFFYPIMIDWILNIFSVEFIIQSSLTKLDCPFAIFKCHAYLSIIILFFQYIFTVNSTSSNTSSTKYDPDLLKADVIHAKSRVQRLRRELASIDAEVSYKQRGVETLAL